MHERGPVPLKNLYKASCEAFAEVGRCMYVLIVFIIIRMVSFAEGTSHTSVLFIDNKEMGCVL